MAILKVQSTANGVVGVWLVHDLRLTQGAEFGAVTLHGYASEEQAATRTGLLWEEYTQVHPAALQSGATWMEDIENLLVQPGEAFAGGVVVAGLSSGDLETAKARKWATIKHIREKVISSGFTVPGLGSFNSDLQSRVDIIGAGAAMLAAGAAGQEFSTEFTLLDNTSVTLGAEGINALGMGLGAHLDAVHRHARALRPMIEEAESLEEVEAIDWDTYAPEEETPVEEEALPPPVEDPAPEVEETPGDDTPNSDETVEQP